MANVKLTKNELKTQKDHLKQYQRYLPTLQLKKQQLQTVIMKVKAEHEKVEEQRRGVVSGLDDWIAVFGENQSFADDHKIQLLVQPDRVEYTTENIAGVEVPNFRELTFKDVEYSVDEYPLWVDYAVVTLRDIARLDALCKTLATQEELLEK